MASGIDSSFGASGTNMKPGVDRFFEHPTNQQEAHENTRHILFEADDALHAKTPEERANVLKKITKELEAMTPAERELMAANFKKEQRKDDHENVQTRQKDFHNVPFVHIELDGKDLKSLDFCSVSDDSAFGQKASVSLDHKRMTYDASDTAITRPDGSHIVVSKGAGDIIEEVKQPDGKVITRQQDGSYLYYDENQEEGHRITNLTVGKDGSISYHRVDDDGVDAAVNEIVAASGDRITTTDTVVNGKAHQEKTTDHTDYPKDAQQVVTTTTESDGKITGVEKLTESWPVGDNIDNDHIRATRTRDCVTLVPMENGKTNGWLQYKPTYTDGELTGGKLDVTYPDGVKRSYPVDVYEMQNVLTARDLKVIWRTEDGDSHHFDIAGQFD